MLEFEKKNALVALGFHVASIITSIVQKLSDIDGNLSINWSKKSKIKRKICEIIERVIK